jgi:integrase
LKKRADGRYLKNIIIKGKTKSFYGRTKAEVNQKILSYKEKIEKGRFFKEVADEWQNKHYKTITNGTQRGYTGSYNRVISAFGDRLISEIKSTEINDFIIAVSKQGFAQETVKRHIFIFNFVFNHAILNGEILHNPASVIKCPKNLPKKSREFPSDEQIEIVKKSYKLHFGLFAYLLLYTGCRKGEALALRYEDINVENKTISINKSIEYLHNRPHIKAPKTKAGTRDIILLDILLDKLDTTQTGFIFGGTEPLTEQTVRRAWERYKKESDITITPHQLRHAYATMLFEAGIDIKDAQDLLGHSTMAVTSDIYTHIKKQRKELTAEKLNNFVG